MTAAPDRGREPVDAPRRSVAALRCTESSNLAMGPGTASDVGATAPGAPARRDVVQFAPGAPRRDAAGNLEPSAGWALVDTEQLPGALEWASHPASAAMGVTVELLEGWVPAGVEHACPRCQRELGSWTALVAHLEAERAASA